MKTELNWNIKGLVIASVMVATFLNGIAILNFSTRIAELEQQQKDGWWNNLPALDTNNVLVAPIKMQ